MKTITNPEGIRLLSKQEQRKITGGNATGYCGVKIDGAWHRLNDTDGNGTTIEQAREYVANGFATNWCCDSCSWNTTPGRPRPPHIIITN